MDVLEILHFGDPVLRTKAKTVTRVNASVRKILDDMLLTMHEAAGVGLAAPQVGIQKRMVVVDVGEGPYFLVNPEIVARSEETEVKWEGCLSWPGYIGEVERPVRVTVKALDRDGHDTWVEGEGFLARALCHEIDHLDGVLFIDRAETITEAPKPGEGEEEDRPPTAVFMGSPDFAVPTLVAMVHAGVEVLLVVTQSDKPVGRKQLLKPTPVKEQALLLDIPVLAVDDVASPEVVKRIEETSPDFIVVSAFGQKLPGALLAMPHLACLNVHPSLLPKYRGGNPVQRAVMNGDLVSGVTIIYLSDRMDSGDVIIQRSVEISPDETYGALEERLASMGAELLLEAINLICAGSAPRVSQDEASVTMAPHLRKDEDVIDWTRPGKVIHDLVRGLVPRPGAVTFFGEERIKVWETALVPGDSSVGSPGAILRMDGDFAVVKTGDGAIVVRRVQPAGGKVMDVAAFLAGRKKTNPAFGRL